ncbi:MAG: putative selenium-dependent hydroxylase accessory protein YqeC [Spirochaetales bacterium]|nr:putative selenium-dependent hydroxylase accessory protein YqeC [Spirochaetales bacterium]
MNLLPFVRPEKGSALISIAGGGGKTATLFELGRLLRADTVLMTTTTKIMKPEPSPFYNIIDEKRGVEPDWRRIDRNREKPLVFGYGSPSYPGKLTGVPLPFLEEAIRHFNYVIVEADGSARRPLKAPADHEPVISPYTDIYIGLIGLDVLDCPGDDSKVHRPELFELIRDKDRSAPVTGEDLIRLINHDRGLFKNAPDQSSRIVLLNKADLISRKVGEALCREIKDNLEFDASVVLNSYRESESVLYSL